MNEQLRKAIEEATRVEPRDFMGEYVLAADHDRIVKEIKNESLSERLTISNTLNEVIDVKNRTIAELRANLSTCQSVLQGAFNVQTDLKEEIAELRAEVERTKGFKTALEDAVIKYRKTIATQAKVIEIAKRVLHNAGLRPPDGGTPSVETICEDLSDAMTEISAIEKEGAKE